MDMKRLKQLSVFLLVALLAVLPLSKALPAYASNSITKVATPSEMVETDESIEIKENEEEADLPEVASNIPVATPSEFSSDNTDVSDLASLPTRSLRTLKSSSTLLRGANYAVGGNIFKSLSLSAYYNGSNIIVDFAYTLGSNLEVWWVYMGWTGELYRANARVPNNGGAAANSYSNFGTITYTKATPFWRNSVDVAGYITITDPTGLANWYNSNNHAYWFSTYHNSSSDGVDNNYVCSNMNPMSIAGMSTALAQGTCSHTYACTAVDGTTHRTACTKCGYVLGTGTHDSNVSDTTSNPGYTVHKCSACGYASSTTANTYTVTLDGCGATDPGSTSVSAVFNNAMPAISVPKKTGYQFLGYYSGQNGTGTKYYSETGQSASVYNTASDTTLYAAWLRSYEITTTGTLANDFRYTGT